MRRRNSPTISNAYSTEKQCFTIASGGARTPNPRFRRPMLYPIELRTRDGAAARMIAIGPMPTHERLYWIHRPPQTRLPAHGPDHSCGTPPPSQPALPAPAAILRGDSAGRANLPMPLQTFDPWWTGGSTTPNPAQEIPAMPITNHHAASTPAMLLPRIDPRSFLLGGGLFLAAAWFGLLRPSQQHLAGLERQVSQISRVVNELNASATGTKGANSLLWQLQIQGRQLGDAEAAFDRFEKLAGRIAAQASAIEQATAAIERSDALHAGIAARGPAIGNAKAVLDDIAELSTKVQASRNGAHDAREALAVLDTLHDDLKAQLARIDTAMPVLDDLTALVGKISGSATDVDRATGILERTAQLEQSIIDRETTLPSAERTFERMANLNASLAGQDSAMGPAEQRLGRLVALKNSVVSGSDGIDDAAATLTRLHDLRDGLRSATGTIGGVQHMIVDVMLLEPAVGRAVQALKPVIDFTRAARQANPDSMAPTQTIPASSPQSAPAEETPIAGVATSGESRK